MRFFQCITERYIGVVDIRAHGEGFNISSSTSQTAWRHSHRPLCIRCRRDRQSVGWGRRELADTCTGRRKWVRFIAKQLATKLRPRVPEGEGTTGVVLNGSFASLDAPCDARCKAGTIREPCDNERHANTSGALNKHMYYWTALSNGEDSRFSLRLARLSVTDSLIRILITRLVAWSQGVERLERISAPARAEGSFKTRFTRLITLPAKRLPRIRVLLSWRLTARLGSTSWRHNGIQWKRLLCDCCKIRGSDRCWSWLNLRQPSHTQKNALLVQLEL